MIESIQQKTGDPTLAGIFQQCFLNTLNTTIDLLEDNTAFVVIGDIPAMWLRDSSAQVRPYARFAAEDAFIKQVIVGVIRRRAQYLLIEPYTNAFNKEPNSHGHQTDHSHHNATLDMGAEI